MPFRPPLHTPGIYIHEAPSGPRPIQAVGTSTAGFVGAPPDTKYKPTGKAIAVDNWSQFVAEFAAPGKEKDLVPNNYLAAAVYAFFANGGGRCFVAAVKDESKIAEGLELLEVIDEIAIVAAPGMATDVAYSALLDHARNLGDRVAILDSPAGIADTQRLLKTATAEGDGVKPPASPHAAFYYPWVLMDDPLNRGVTQLFPPSGHMAGIWARTDATRGVHKAPANERVGTALGVEFAISRQAQSELNKAGINVIRNFSREGITVWGARTLAAEVDPNWRYLNVRRLFNMVEESIAEGTRWVVFEPNDQTLWKSIRRDVTAFMMQLWRAGALLGATPEEAFFVKCDEETNPREDINAGIVRCVIGMAPVKPAEFIVFEIGQSADTGE